MNAISRIQHYWNGLLKSAEVTDEAKSILQPANLTFLITVGLPADRRLRDIKALGIEFLPTQIHVIEFEGTKYVIVGQYFFVHLIFRIAIKEQSNEIYILIKREKEPYDALIEFVNSSIEQFLEFIIEYIQWSSKVWAIFKDWDQIVPREPKEARILKQKELRTEMDTYVDNLQNALKKIDKVALEGNTYWNQRVTDLYLV